MDFGELSITGEIKYNILEEECENISLNGIFWVKVRKLIWQGKLIQIPFSNKNRTVNI